MANVENLPARPQDVADVMLEQTAASTPMLRFKKGQWLIGENEIEQGHEYRSFPFDALRGFVKWEDNAPAEQRIGRIADRFNLEREDLPADEDWQPQIVLPLEDAESGEIVAFVSSSFGGKKAVNALINSTARAVKEGRSDGAPLVRLGVGSFTSKQYGEVSAPVFEVVRQSPPEVKTIKDEMSDQIPF